MYTCGCCITPVDEIMGDFLFVGDEQTPYCINIAAGVYIL